MATLTPYLSQNIRVGQQAELKLHEFRWRTVGRGEVKTLSDFELAVDARVELAIYKGDLQIRVVLTDQDTEAQTGSCILQVNTLVDDQATYRVRGDRITISTVIDGTDVRVDVFRSTRDNMTECKVSGPFDLTAYIAPKGG